ENPRKCGHSSLEACNALPLGLRVLRATNGVLLPKYCIFIGKIKCAHMMARAAFSHVFEPRCYPLGMSQRLENSLRPGRRRMPGFAGIGRTAAIRLMSAPRFHSRSACFFISSF